ncbi:Protein of unknown function [Gryllus bimaculatus]|nr:Protein of unknown function [Gryllus bimaculatus]
MHITDYTSLSQSQNQPGSTRNCGDEFLALLWSYDRHHSGRCFRVHGRLDPAGRRFRCRHLGAIHLTPVYSLTAAHGSRNTSCREAQEAEFPPSQCQVPSIDR